MSARNIMPGTRRFILTPKKRQIPVPSNIDIAQAADQKPITQVAEEVGILPDELELTGPYKAKARLEILKRLEKDPIENKST